MKPEVRRVIRAELLNQLEAQKAIAAEINHSLAIIAAIEKWEAKTEKLKAYAAQKGWKSEG